MSSACTCHTDEWCFYCNMYTPLEQDHRWMRFGIKNVIESLKGRYEDAMLIRSKGGSPVNSEMYGRMVELRQTIDQLMEVLDNANTESKQHATESKQVSQYALSSAGQGKKGMGTNCRVACEGAEDTAHGANRPDL